MISILRGHASTSNARARSRKIRVQPRIEDLEGRSLLTAIPLNFGATPISAPVVVNGEMFFAAQDSTHGVQLWESNGTAAGTIRLTDGNDKNDGIYPSDLTAVGGTLYFSANDGLAAFGGVGDGDQLWKSNGTAAGTTMVTDGNDGVAKASLFPYELTDVGGTLYFAAADLNDGEQLFKSNGTAAGTTMVKDIPGANGYPGSYPGNLTAEGSQLYFSASGAGQGTQLWTSNGTAAGTVQLSSGNASSGGTGPQSLAAASGAVYFSGFDPTDRTQLWSSNGTAGGTKRLTTGNAASTGMNPQFVTAAGGTVYFAADDGVHGTQLWSSNGTTTTMLTSGNVAGGGVSPTDLTMVGNTVYFAADDGVHGSQLWSSNGTAAGTGMVADINGTTTADVTNITDVNGTAYFVAYTNKNGFQIWQTNGTSSGTVMDTSLSTGTTAPLDLTAVGNDLYFKAAGATLWEWAPSATKATPTITWATPAAITYGTALTSTQLDATASVPGTFVYSPAAGTVPKAGSDTLSVTFTPTDTTDYTSATATTTLVVLSANSATLLKQDTATQGNWIGTYGSQGYDVIGSSASLPGYATITPAGQLTYTWAASTTDQRALQTAGGGGRIAACWYQATSFTVTVNLTDNQIHDLELYFLDWDNQGRSEQVQISSATTGAVLSTQSVSSFHSGAYLDYAVSGDVVITITRQAGPNAVLSGLFLDPSQGAATISAAESSSSGPAMAGASGASAGSTASIEGIGDLPDLMGTTGATASSTKTGRTAG